MNKLKLRKKKTSRGRAFAGGFCFILILIVLLPMETLAEEKVRVRVGIFDYKAFYGEDSDGKPSGYGYEYLNTLEQYGNFHFEYVYGSWAECQEWLDAGIIDMVDSAQKTPEREEKFLFSEYSTGTSYGELFVSVYNQAAAYNDFKAMDGMKIGFLEGNSRNKTFEAFAQKNGFSYNTVIYKTSEELSEALRNQEVDAIVSSNLRQEKEERTIARFAPTPFYLMMNREQTDLKIRVDQALEQILIDFPEFNAELNRTYYTDFETTPMLTHGEREFVRTAAAIRAVYLEDAAPFSKYNIKSGEADGIQIRLLNLIGRKVGLEFEYVPVRSIEEGMELLLNGEVDLFVGAEPEITPGEEFGYAATNPFLSVPSCLVGVNGTVKKDDIFAVPFYWKEIIPFLEEHFPQVTVKVYDSVPECYEAVSSGAADFTTDNIYAATDLIRRGNYGKLKIVAALPASENFVFAVSPFYDPILIRILNEGIRTMTRAERDTVYMEYEESNNSGYNAIVFLDEYREIVIGGITLFAILLIGVLLLFVIRLRASKKELWKMAYVDPLTGCHNLNYFKEEMRRLLDKNKDKNYFIAKFDIEKFKFFNEMFGFECGDKVLVSLAETVEAMMVPGVDTYGRISGDDFIMLKSYDSIEDNRKLMWEGIRQFSEAIGHEYEYLIQLKFGSYYIKDHEEEISSIIEKVNYAHSVCKDLQNEVLFIYDDEMRQKALDEKRIEARMKEGLLKKQFMLYLQPKYYLSNETLAGAEALVRWSSEDEMDIIYPNSFIPLFEKNGFITKLDMYMLERVCELIQSWIAKGLTPITVSINFSRLHLLNKSFTKEICAITDRYQVPRNYIEIELTESTMFNNEEAMLEVLDHLHEAGFTLSMDDFGSGYSSLGLLKNLPVDVIKIDRHFFTDNRFKSRSRTVISNVMDMARRLNIHTVAEGVESKEHVEFLKEMGCDIVQGFYYSKPMPADQFTLDQDMRIYPKQPKELKIDLTAIGDVEYGRASMGEEMPVMVYRLFQTALRETLKDLYGEGEMVETLRAAGRVAGSAFARDRLDTQLPFKLFIEILSKNLEELKIGELRIESFDENTGSGIFTVSGDIECSGISNQNETLCQYDEGFIAGILKEYTKKNYSVVEIDCWGTGADICRFEVKQK